MFTRARGGCVSALLGAQSPSQVRLFQVNPVRARCRSWNRNPWKPLHFYFSSVEAELLSSCTLHGLVVHCVSFSLSSFRFEAECAAHVGWGPVPEAPLGGCFLHLFPLGVLFSFFYFSLTYYLFIFFPFSAGVKQNAMRRVG